MSAHAGTKYKTTWRASEVGPQSFAGKKVAAVVISDDESLRMSSEEALVRELAARGVEGVPAYRIVPKEALRKAETARPFFERAGLEGVIVLRPVSVDPVKEISGISGCSTIALPTSSPRPCTS